MLIFNRVENNQLYSILDKINCGDANAYRSIINDLSDRYESVEYTDVDGAVMFKFASPFKNPVFTMPLGKNWQVLIPLLVVYTQEHYIHTIYEGIRTSDVNRLLTMYPGSGISVERNFELLSDDVYTIFIK